MAARKPRPAEPASALARYWGKRDFSVTGEPRGNDAVGNAQGPLSFCVQKHWASRLHYDLRLELDGVLLSWAVPKGPSYDPTDKQIAVHIEDHPLAYGSFEGTIPKGQYGAGSVIVWDRGSWEPVGDPRQGMKDGKLVFTLHGHKLFGLWELVRIARPGDRQETWILFKKRDRHARPRVAYDVVSALPRLLATPECRGRVLNLGSDRPISIRDLAALVVRVVGSGSSVRTIPYSEAYPAGFEDLRQRQPDLSRIRAAIGFEPRTPLDQTIRDVAAFLKERRP